MTYISEFDELPWEARKDQAATFRYWPKVDGRNVTASSVSGEVSFTVHKPDGSQIQGSTNVSPTAVGKYSRLDLVVSAIATLDEGYTVRLTWRQASETEDYFEVIPFDVVLYPFGSPWVSLNDLLELRASAGDALDRLGQGYEYASGDQARAYAAGVCAYNGRLALDARIRAAVLGGNVGGASETSPGSARDDNRGRPHLILDRKRLIRVERYEAAAHLYRAIAPDPEEGEDPMSALYRHFVAEADKAWQQVGPLRYDASEDLTADQVVEDLSSVVYMRRRQA